MTTTIVEQTTGSTFIKASRKRRITAFIIDHFLIMFLMLSSMIIVQESNFVKGNRLEMLIVMMLIVILEFVLYFAKDCVKGISIGKWIVGIMVRDANDPNMTPSFGRLFLRNLFIMLLPIEFIVLIASDQKKRLGDRLTKIIVVKNPDKATRRSRALVLESYF